MLGGEATNTNFIVFGLTRSGLELTICRTRGEQANQRPLLNKYNTQAHGFHREHLTFQYKCSRHYIVFYYISGINLQFWKSHQHRVVSLLQFKHISATGFRVIEKKLQNISSMTKKMWLYIFLIITQRNLSKTNTNQGVTFMI